MHTTAGPVPDQAGALQHEPEMELQEETAMPEPTAAAADIDLPEPTANDISMLEEEVEVER